MQPIPSSQVNHQCPVCSLQPVPESTQHILFIITQIVLIFFNIKLSVIVLMIGYSFPMTKWKCPFCGRDVNTDKQGLGQNLIIRLGNCMALLSVNKFRIIAVAVIALMLYFFAQQPKFVPKVPIQNTWQSLVTNCGYQQYIQNSFHANHFYSLYSQSGNNWSLQGIYLSTNSSGIADYQYFYIKMNPSQFKDQQAYDFRVFTNLANNLKLQKGDILTLKGEWEGRQYYNMIFMPTSVTKTQRKAHFKKIKYFYESKSMLRGHLDAVKPQYQDQNQQKKDAQQISNKKVQ